MKIFYKIYVLFQVCIVAATVSLTMETIDKYTSSTGGYGKQGFLFWTIIAWIVMILSFVIRRIIKKKIEKSEEDY